MNTPARLVVRVLALGVAGEAVSLVMDALDGGGADNADIGAGFLVVVALGLVTSVGAFADARRTGFEATVGLWAAVGATLGLLLAVSAPFRHGDWHRAGWVGGMWADVVVAVPLVAVVVTCPALLGGMVGSAVAGRSSRG